MGGDYDVISQVDYLNQLMSQPLLFNVGQKFEYSDSGYSLLAQIIERASGLSYEDYLYQHLFKPAGMENTGYSRPKFKIKDIAVGYKHDRYWGKPTDKKWDVDAPYANLKGAQYYQRLKICISGIVCYWAMMCSFVIFGALWMKR